MLCGRHKEPVDVSDLFIVAVREEEARVLLLSSTPVVLLRLLA